MLVIYCTVLVVGAKEQVRVFREAKFRRCQSIKWTVDRKASPAEPTSQHSLPKLRYSDCIVSIDDILHI